MEIVYDPTDRISESYNTCEFTFSDGSTVTLTPSGIEDLTRANLEYDSPLIYGEFPEQGGFYYYSYAYEDQTIYFNKIFKPFDCTQVLLTESYGDNQTATCTITFTDNEVYCCYVLNFSSQSEDLESVEVDRHLQNLSVETYNGFSFVPHETQINGSEFRVSPYDYLYRPRGNYIRNFNITIPDFMNYSLARDGSKFFIGAYARDGMEE